MSAGAAVLLASVGWFALALICGMLAEYRSKIIAALLFEPLPSEQRFHAGEPVSTIDERRRS
ncbi:hypothetical protein [Sphingobium bisphenolivorans]|uniref:hypothetical protein n=1 Tax=Sphingobium bisphenolivorans TaxID=1335760 RepID=UPI0003A61F51|nr:hypothetical protein [Sphingobium bisphenolivorans]